MTFEASTESKALDICVPQDRDCIGPEQAHKDWYNNKRFIKAGGSSVQRTELSRYKERGYTHVRLFFGHRFHFVETIP